MTRAQRGTLKWAVRLCIDAIGVDRCAEICGGVNPTTIYRYANPNEPHECPAHYALALDRECWLRDGIAPFREVFEMNAGDPPHLRTAAALRRMAEDMERVA